MARYIDAEQTLADAWNALYQEEDKCEEKVVQGRNEAEIDNWLVNERPILQDGFELCQKAIVNAPTADVRENVHGKWIIEREQMPSGEIAVGQFCSNCNYPQYLTTNFCPNCGAKMDL